MNRLNPRQQEAVNWIDGPLLVLAGAGSGKTSVITQKIAHLIQNCGMPARRIAAVTFTNKASREMKERVLKLVPREQARGLIVSTFHNLGLRIIKAEMKTLELRRGFSIMDQSDSRELMRELQFRGQSERDTEMVEFFQRKISQWKNDLVTAEQAMSLADTDEMQRAAIIYGEYNRMLRACNAVDFDDLIMLPALLFRQHPDILEKWRNRIRHLLVDEYQDTNSAQYELVKQLVEPLNRFTVVGDDDQSIYAWRGARPENLEQLQVDFPTLKVIKLEQNYRSTGCILKAANAVISNNPHVFEKSLWSDYGFGEPIRSMSLRNEEAEIEWIAGDIIRKRLTKALKWKDFAVLYRNNFQSRLLELKFQTMQVPYKVSGGQSFFARTEIKDLMCYLRLLVNPDDDNAFLRIINTPRREIGPATLEKLANWATKRNQGMYHVCDDIALDEILGNKAATRLRQFKSWLDHKRELCFSDNSLQAVTEMISDMDYEEWLMSQSASPRIGERKVANVQQLVSSIERMLEKQEEEDDDSDLEAVIRKLVLIDMLEQQDEEDDSDRVQMLTLHAAKGLEYPHVYMMGVEEELLPHRVSIEQDSIAEERRLMYVGITRARETLTMTHALSRKQYGERFATARSRFIEEMPQEDIDFQGEGVEVDEEKTEQVAEDTLAAIRAMLK